MAVRLTDAQVREVREKFAEGARQTDLAAEYGISQNTVSSLVLGRTRRPAGGPLSPGTAQKLTVEEVRRIRHDLATGSSKVDLAHQYGVSQQMISHIAAGRAFADVNGPLIVAKRAPAPPLTKVQVEDIRDRVHDGQAREPADLQSAARGSTAPRDRTIFGQTAPNDLRPGAPDLLSARASSVVRAPGDLAVTLGLCGDQRNLTMP